MRTVNLDLIKLADVEICQEGLDFFNGKNSLNEPLAGKKDNEVLNIALETEDQEALKWWESLFNSTHAWDYWNESYAVNHYFIYNQVLEIEQKFNTLNEAKKNQKIIYESIFEKYKKMTSVALVKYHENNDVEWCGVDSIETYENDGVFQVFNYWTGTHIQANSKIEAIEIINNIVSENIFKPSIFACFINQNQISSNVKLIQ